MPSQISTHVVIYLVGSGQHWTARAYEDDEDGRHLWSSEDASSPEQALREVAEEISRV